MKKRSLAVIMAIMMFIGLVGCSTTSEPEGSTGETTESTEAKDAYHVIWVSCSTESEFWQYQEIGMRNAVLDMQEELGIEIQFETVGPANESETEAYIRAFENAIAANPDAIISATQVPDATIAVSRAATDAGIVVNFTNCGLEVYGSNEYDDVYNQFYTTISADIGELAAQIMLDELEAKGIEPVGTIGMHFSNINEALQPRMDDFQKYLAEAAPDIEVLDTLYNANDLETAQSNVENQISTYGDKLIGLYGANNLSASGIALAVKNANIGETVVNIGVDSDSLAIEALEAGDLQVLIVQEAYGQGYAALKNAIETLVNGSNPETQKQVLLPPVAVTSDNMHEEEYAALLDPTMLRR